MITQKNVNRMRITSRVPFRTAIGKSLGEGRAGVGEAEGIGSESAGASGKGRGATTRGRR